MRKLQTAVAYFVSIALIIGATFFGDHHLSVTQRSASDVDAGSDSGLLVRSGFSGLTPTANQTWVFNILDNRLYAYDGHNWQQQTLGRIQGAGIGAPTSSNDTNQGYSVGSLWWDTVGLNWYICQSNTASAAVWNVFTNRVAQTDINNSVAPKLSYADIMSDCVISGLLGSAPSSSLTMTTPAGVAYVGGLRTIAAAQSYTYPASQDTYDYLSSTGIISHTSVANGGSAPVGPTGLNIQKVVTNGTQITAVTQRSNTAPVTNVANATPSTQNAIPISQADARYATYGSINGPFSANYFMASPNGSSGSLTPRAIVSTDLPIVGIAQGGLGGATSATFGGVLYGNGLNTYLQTGSPPGPFYYLRSNSSNSALEWALTAGIGSITWSLPSYMTASPITMTTSGTQTFSFNNQNACLLFGGPANPTASATAPGFNSYDELASMGGASGTRPLPTMSTPSAPGTITHGGTAGTTSYSYAVAAVMSDTVTSSPASTATSTSTGNAALSSSNTNVIPMPSLPT
ncbi:MAG TPA: hypothetical protein VHV83_07120, partial [Armatimonadota bacterium]|nr:hypothetical protein [Armatimonadota bacterium]